MIEISLLYIAQFPVKDPIHIHMAVQHRRRPVPHLLHGLFSSLHLLAKSPARFRQGFLLFCASLCVPLHFGRFAQSVDGQQKAPERGFRGINRYGLDFYSL